MRSFKKALVKSLLFALIFTLLCTPSLAMYGHYKSNNNNSLPELKANSGTIDLLFCGASQTVWGMVPEVMDEAYGCSSFNIASGLLSMEGRYVILQQVLKENPVRTVVMDFSIDGLRRSDETDSVEGDLLLLEHLRGSEKWKYALTHITVDEVFPSFYYMMRSGTYTLLQKVLRRSEAQDVPYRGKGYWGNQPASDQRGQVLWNKESLDFDLPYEANERNLEYLDKIMALCREKGIRMVFVTTPYPTRVLSWHDCDSMLDLHLQLAQRYGCPLYDVNLYKEKAEMFDDATDYYDEEHLSTQGAVKMTRLLAELMTAKNPGVGQSDLFYANYDELITAYLQSHPEQEEK